MTKDIDLVARLRSLCLSLPGTDETSAWDHPNFRVGKKTFAVFEVYQGRPCISVKLSVPERQILLADERFFVTPYLGKHGWTSLWVDMPVTWSLVEDLVRRSHGLVAPARFQVSRSKAHPRTPGDGNPRAKKPAKPAAPVKRRRA